MILPRSHHSNLIKDHNQPIRQMVNSRATIRRTCKIIHNGSKMENCSVHYVFENLQKKKKSFLQTKYQDKPEAKEHLAQLSLKK